MKPDWCPEDVWEDAAKALQWRGAGDRTIRSSAAQAILSERNRIIEICDAEIALCRQYGVEHIPMIENIKRQVTKGSL